MATRRSKKLLEVWVDYDPRFDHLRQRSRCPIANRLKEVPDILTHTVDVQRATISFTYSTTRMRYEFRAPPLARRFIQDIDMGVVPRPFMLVLRESDLGKSWFIGPILNPKPIKPDGRGSGQRGPRMRPAPATV